VEEPLTHDAAGLLPSQVEHSACGVPEKGLWFTVLCQALQDASGHPAYIGGTGSARRARVDRLAASARKWVTGNANRLGTFRWCCEIFELDADLVRARLKTGSQISFGEELLRLEGRLATCPKRTDRAREVSSDRRHQRAPSETPYPAASTTSSQNQNP
jgi:hypothetical protein